MNDKPICPDSVDCEVIEENHFKQLSHPHLDEVLKGRLEEDVTFHYVLQFKPKVRFLRYDQLVVLQKVLLEEKAASERKQLTITTQHLNTENKIDNQVKTTSSQNVGTLPKVLYRDIRTLNVNKTIVEKNLAASSNKSSMQQNSFINNNSVSKLNFKNLVANPTTSSVQRNSTVNNNLVTKQHVKTPVVNNNATPMQQISTVNNNLGSKLNFKTLVANTTASSMPQHVTYTKYLVTMPPAKTPVTSTITSQMQQNSTLNNNLVTNQHVKRPVSNNNTSPMQQNSTINKTLVTKPHGNTLVVITTASPMPQPQHVTYVTNSFTKPHVNTQVVSTAPSSMPQHVTYIKTLVTKPHGNTLVVITTASPMPQPQHVTYVTNSVTKPHINTQVVSTPSSPMTQRVTYVTNPVTKPHVNTQVVSTTPSSMPQHVTYTKTLVTKPHVNTPAGMRTIKLTNQNFNTNNSTTNSTGNTKPIVFTPGVNNNLTKVSSYKVTQNNTPTPSVSELSKHSNAIVLKNNTPVTMNQCVPKLNISSAGDYYKKKKNQSTILTAKINNKPTLQGNKIQTKPSNTQVSKFVNNTATLPIKQLIVHQPTNKNNQKLTIISSKSTTSNDSTSYKTPVNSSAQQIYISNQNTMYKLTPQMSTSKVNKKSLGSPITTTINSTSYNTPVNSSNKRARPTTSTKTTSKVVKKPLNSPITTTTDSTSYNTPVNSLNNQPIPSTSSLTYEVNKKPLDLPILTTIDDEIPKKSFNNYSIGKSNNSIKNSSTISPTSNKRPSDSSTNFESKKLKQNTDNNSITEDNYLDCLLRKFDDCSTQNDRENIRLEAINQMSNFGSSILNLQPHGKFIDKYNNSSPYYFFYSSIYNNKNTWNKKNTITFPEILDSSLGQIQSSFHITSLLNTKWLRQQYLLAAQKNDCFIIYDEIDNYDEIPNNIKTLKIKLPIGKHNSKISILNYDNGARIVMLTGSLNPHDWLNNSQGVWISPNLPYLPAGTNPSIGESKTGFKADFMNYLRAYKNKKIESLLKLIVRLDFSCIDVFFISSVPGTHSSSVNNQWGINKVSELLKKHSAKIENEYTICPVIAQTSVANNLKSIESDWFHQEIIPKLTNDKIMTEIITPTPLFKFIYPTINNYKSSFDAKDDINNCSFDNLNFDDKQEWLKAYMYQWISMDKQANDAMPSINSYTKLLSGFKEIPWFILTSHNLSKDAWGYCKNPNDSTTTILNYEAGIIFFPKFLISKDTFPLVEPNEYGTPAFTLPYELPLTPYGPDDKPYVTDYISTIGK